MNAIKSFLATFIGCNVLMWGLHAAYANTDLATPWRVLAAVALVQSVSAAWVEWRLSAHGTQRCANGSAGLRGSRRPKLKARPAARRAQLLAYLACRRVMHVTRHHFA